MAWHPTRSFLSWRRLFLKTYIDIHEHKRTIRYLVMSTGWSQVQRIRERHCCCQPFLSWLNSVWSDSDSNYPSTLKLFFAEFERSPKMTWFDFISSFGGFCGLCLGISFVSVVEIFYWFSIRLCRNFAIWIISCCFSVIRQLETIRINVLVFSNNFFC